MIIATSVCKGQRRKNLKDGGLIDGIALLRDIVYLTFKARNEAWQ